MTSQAGYLFVKFRHNNDVFHHILLQTTIRNHKPLPCSISWRNAKLSNPTTNSQSLNPETAGGASGAKILPNHCSRTGYPLWAHLLSLPRASRSKCPSTPHVKKSAIFERTSSRWNFAPLSRGLSHKYSGPNEFKQLSLLELRRIGLRCYDSLTPSDKKSERGSLLRMK